MIIAVGEQGQGEGGVDAEGWMYGCPSTMDVQCNDPSDHCCLFGKGKLRAESSDEAVKILI